MGVDLQAIRLLTEYTKDYALGDVVTLGRQGLSLSRNDIKVATEKYGIKKSLVVSNWCESLLIEHFGATSVQSLDCSDFEGATIIHDLNEPLQIRRQFDLVLDFGTSEHVYNVKVVYENIRALCKQGGGIIHLLPANNFCGHGFYQFSPMFFRSVYDAMSGFDMDVMYLAKMSTDIDWFKVDVVAVTDRFVFYNDYPTTIMVILVKRTDGEELKIQQPDYQNRWNGVDDCGVNRNQNNSLRNLKYFLLNNGMGNIYRILEWAYKKLNPYHGYSTRLEKLPYVKKDGA